MKEREPRNRTLTCSDAELAAVAAELLRLAAPTRLEDVVGRIIHQGFHDACRFRLAFADLVILTRPTT